MAFEKFPVWMMRTANDAPATANEQTGTAAVASNGYKPATKEELEAISAALMEVHDERVATSSTRKQVTSEKTSRAAEHKPASKEVPKDIPRTLEETPAEYDAEIRAKYTGEPANKQDLNAITAALKECNDRRDTALGAKTAAAAEQLADKKHTGIGSKGGCCACQREYKLNGRTQADFAGHDIDVITTSDSKEKKGGPLDGAAADCVVM